MSEVESSISFLTILKTFLGGLPFFFWFFFLNINSFFDSRFELYYTDSVSFLAFFTTLSLVSYLVTLVLSLLARIIDFLALEFRVWLCCYCAPPTLMAATLSLFCGLPRNLNSLLAILFFSVDSFATTTSWACYLVLENV